mmetsp:Transcript_31947/g.93932  ORF Transcript_31947/g.93932 Transcript_31947/m.93932 type:complete len:303 (+) Transcript_31947:206-1114(+)
MEAESYEGVSIQLFLCFSIVGGRLSFSSTAIVHSFECHAGEGLIEICSGHIEIILRQMSSLPLPRNRSVEGGAPSGRICAAIGDLLILLVGLPAFTGSDWRTNAPIAKGSPVNFTEELMLHSTLDAKHPHPFARIPFKELTHARSRFHAEEGWDVQRRAFQTPKELGPVRCVPWGEACHHFVCEHTQAPVVDAKTMAGLRQNFRRHVLGCSAHRRRTLAGMRDPILGKSKITKLHVSICIKEDILRLQVAIYYSLLVQMAQGKEKFCREESSNSFWEASISRKMEEEFSPRAVIQNEIKFVF